jgi:hypothetical protein
MGRSRRSRRRIERQRSKHQAPRRSFSPLARAGILVAGAICVIAGVALLTAGNKQSETRLARVAGILIVLGLVGIGAAVLGWL